MSFRSIVCGELAGCYIHRTYQHLKNHIMPLRLQPNMLPEGKYSTLSYLFNE